MHPEPWNLKNIELPFLVLGHSQNENDTAHSVIESHYRNRIIYTPGQWESTIQQAFKTNFYQVTVLSLDDITDFKSSLYFPQYSTVLAGKCFPEVLGVSKTKLKKVMWSKIVQLKVIEEDPDMPYFKYSYDSDYEKCKFKTTNTRYVGMSRTAKRQKYKSQKGITLAKKKDLLMLCKNGLIPKQHHAFFDSLIVATSGEKEDDIALPTVRKMSLLMHIKIGQNLH